MATGGWSGFSDEELMENPDYIAELRFGGDPSSDEAIKRRIYVMSEDEFDDFDREGGYGGYG